MLRKLALSLAVSAALGASHANALGLGEIRVNSALNEPLDAEIRLTQVRDLSPLQIQPRMASLDEYAVGSSAQARYLRDIQFQVLVSPEGNGRIRLRSTEPVQEPFLNFMVEVNWPSGRLVREYTLLLDPPVFDAAPSVQPVTSTPARTTQQVSSQPSRPSGNVDNIRTRAGENQVYVGVNDTLWEIAKAHKPAGVTEHQMMLALLRKNPQAFPSRNINTMRAGVVMDLPSVAEAQQLSHREAVAEVARQMQLWRDGKAGMTAQQSAPVDVSKPAPEAEAADSASTETDEAASGESETEDPKADAEGTTEAAASAEAGAEEGQLTIVAPEDQAEETGETAPAGESVDTSGDEATPAQADQEQVITEATRQLEDDVLVAQEKIDVLERENADLNDKLNSVLEQLESQSRMLELQSQQMATLQAELSKQEARAAEPEPKPQGLLENPVVLGGIGAGALAILAGLWLALRRRGSDKPKEAKPKELVNVPDELKHKEERDDSMAPAAAAAGAAAGVAAGAAAAETEDSDEIPRPAPLSSEEDDEEFTRPPMQSLSQEDDAADLNDDLQSLDLDMDLDLDDLDSASDQVEEPASAGDLDELDASEFDLGIEEEPASANMAEVESEEPAEAGEAEAPEEPEATEEVVSEADESADDAAAGEDQQEDELEFNVEPLAEEDDTADDLDALLGDDDTSDDLDFMLQDNQVEDESVEDESAASGEDLDALLGGSESDAEMTDEPEEPEVDTSLDDTVESVEDEEYEIDSDLEAMLAGAADDEDEEDLFASSETDAEQSADDDLDSLLADFDPESDDESEESAPATPSKEQVEEELTSNISHDLEMDLDSELDEMLNSTDDDIELSEDRNEEAVEVLDKMNLLSGTDETETKLDLARAYLEMDDKDGARDILQEITNEGSDEQRAQAQKLLDSLD
ncbi:hypothetical protein H9C73_09800 [Marinobacterium sp. AK62]|uniref:FimV N-terminal domain-containing protein n=1 Tax=Marinobacterium alkalitolerans TaxID=1542925 RepID=A0ABS3ZCM0_9GAMM|nr:FimV/HubP family polar landmark protein [Marinobacterium alkalitolerans]MBP0049033.1 hypothetical protein [Marinobacterium alkalitolerans]